MGVRGIAKAAATVVAAVALTVGIVPALPAAPAAASTPSAEQDFVERLNAERRARGLGELTVNTDLRGVARDWSDRMAACTKHRSRSDCLEHNPDYGVQITSRVTNDWSRLGENVGYTIQTGASSAQLVKRLHTALMNSTGHRKNILGAFNQVGVGVTIAADGSMWVTQNFMKAPLTGSSLVKSAETYKFTLSDDAVPISGDWNGDGKVTPGWFDKGTVYLRNTHGSGGAHIVFSYGRAGDVPIVGDWDGNGVDSIGVLRKGTWYLRNANSGGNADHAFTYGRLTAGDYALAGDWNGDGKDTVGIVRKGEWHLRNKLKGGPADRVFVYGRVRKGDVPVVGDWSGNGIDTPGIIRKGEWHLRDKLRGGPADKVFRYGDEKDLPLVGNWDGKGKTATPGIVRKQDWHLRDKNAGGSADHTYTY